VVAHAAATLTQLVAVVRGASGRKKGESDNTPAITVIKMTHVGAQTNHGIFFEGGQRRRT